MVHDLGDLLKLLLKCVDTLAVSIGAGLLFLSITGPDKKHTFLLIVRSLKTQTVLTSKLRIVAELIFFKLAFHLLGRLWSGYHSFLVV